jgi:prepilin-type N-terminal cleavage/methylation domain-containing protein
MRLECSVVEGADNRVLLNDSNAGSEGFSLVESLIAILIFALGFMFVAPLIYTSMQSTTLSRSKDTAALAATSQLEALALKYKANASDTDLTPGIHGPVQIDINNPNDTSGILNRFNVNWTVGSVPDARGRTLRAVQVTVTATPEHAGSTGSGTVSVGGIQNKTTSITTIFSYRAP